MRAAKRGGRRVLAALALASACRAHLVVRDGPAHLIGLELVAGPMRFSPARFDVLAPMLVTQPGEWAYDACPPRYTGARELRGTIVVHLSPGFERCSYEQHARGAGALGALGWAAFNFAATAGLGREPGGIRYWSHATDSHFLPEPPAFDLNQRAALPLMAHLRDGGGSVRVRVRPSHTPWDAMWEHPLATGLAAVVGMQSGLNALYATLALGRVVRDVGGPRIDVSQAALALEAAANGGRAAAQLNPFLRLRWYDYETALRLQLVPEVLSTCATTLLLVFVAQAAANAGLASLRVTRPAYQRALCALVLALGGLLAAAEVSRALGARMLGANSLLVVMCAGALLPLVVAALALHADCMIRRSLADAPALLVRALLWRVRTSLLLSCLAAGVGAAFPIAYVRPWACAGVFTAYTGLSNATSHVEISAIVGSTTSLAHPLAKAARALGSLCAPRLQRLLGAAARAGGRGAGARSARVGPGARPAGGKGRPEPARAPRSLSRQPSGRGRFPRGASRRVREASAALGAAADELSPRDDDGHLVLGVQLRHLEAWCDEHGVELDTTSADVGRMVAALTRESGQSLAEAHAHVRLPDGTAAVGEANLFVSHAQACSFRKLLGAVRLHAAFCSLDESQLYLWLDLATIRQHDVQAGIRHIGSVIERIGSMVLVLDPWHSAVSLGRMWCLYEVVQCRLHPHVELQLALPPSELGDFLAALDTDASRVLETLSSFDCRTAAASVADDRQRIHELIVATFAPQSGRPSSQMGRNRFAAAVSSAIADALSQAGSFGAARSSTSADGAALDAFNAEVRKALLRALSLASWRGVGPARSTRRRTHPGSQHGSSPNTPSSSGSRLNTPSLASARRFGRRSNPGTPAFPQRLRAPGAEALPRAMSAPNACAEGSGEGVGACTESSRSEPMPATSAAEPARGQTGCADGPDARAGEMQHDPGSLDAGSPRAAVGRSPPRALVGGWVRDRKAASPSPPASAARSTPAAERSPSRTPSPPSRARRYSKAAEDAAVSADGHRLQHASAAHSAADALSSVAPPGDLSPSRQRPPVAPAAASSPSTARTIVTPLTPSAAGSTASSGAEAILARAGAPRLAHVLPAASELQGSLLVAQARAPRARHPSPPPSSPPAASGDGG